MTTVDSLRKLPESSWKSGICRNDNSRCIWFPLVRINNCLIGLTKTADWVVGSEDEKVRIFKMASPRCSPNLALLEIPLSEARAIIRASLISELGDDAAIKSFPESVIVKCGLEHPSEHWQLAALSWAEDAQLDDATYELLKDVAVTSNSQKVQHGAKKILKGRGKWDWNEMRQRSKA